MSQPSYSLINSETFQRLNELDAPRSVLQVIIALNAYAMSDDSCFPALKTIRDYIGSAIGLNTISMALKWLRDNNFIQQNHHSRKDRFVLTYRRAVKLAKQKIREMKSSKMLSRKGDNGKQNVLSPQKNRTNHKYFNNKRKHTKRSSSFISHEEVKRRQEAAQKSMNSAENAMARCLLGLDPTHLNEASKLGIIQGFSDPSGPLRLWARETHQENKICEVLSKIRSCKEVVV